MTFRGLKRRRVRIPVVYDGKGETVTLFHGRKLTLTVALLALLSGSLLVLCSRDAHAIAGLGKHPGDIKPGPGEGWGAFQNFDYLADVVVSMFLAALLGATIAYHPRTYGKAMTLEEFDQPKIFITYAVVGSVVAEIVKAWPDMAIVIFGIGGLLRFRTDAGPARDTGRIILTTCIGLCCGLTIFPVAILATLFAWVLIYLLEARIVHRMVVKGIETANLVKSAETYHEVLVENGLKIMSERKNPMKGQFSFVFRAPGKLDREQLEQLFKDIPPKLQGAVDWESS